jgi:D-hydroxyproline dehydrogenase subunit beta
MPVKLAAVKGLRKAYMEKYVMKPASPAKEVRASDGAERSQWVKVFGIRSYEEMTPHEAARMLRLDDMACDASRPGYPVCPDSLSPIDNPPRFRAIIAGWAVSLQFLMSRAQASERFDLAVVGAGIVGLATALAGVRRGLRVIVIDRDAQANGASVRNFGFITVTGQERHSMWARARRTRDVWSEVAVAAGIPVVHTGLWMLARRPESVEVLKAFLETEMAAGCRLLTRSEARRRCPELTATDMAAVLESTIELRVESREAIPRLAAWLANSHGVTFMRNTSVVGIEVPAVITSRDVVHADRVVVCPGDDFNSLYAERLRKYTLTRCKLQMLRLAPPGFKLPGALMSDLGLGRYSGYADLEAAAPLKARLAREQPEHLKHGIHLIVVQSADGSLVVGDSHHYAETPDPFAREEIDALMLEEFRAALGINPPPIMERWVGTYASAPDRAVLLDEPHPSVRIAIVTSGAGASTGFALGEEVIAGLLDTGVAQHESQ